jgi:hypothetical protein
MVKAASRQLRASLRTCLRHGPAGAETYTTRGPFYLSYATFIQSHRLSKTLRLYRKTNLTLF